jgi:hypothetical protein
MLAFRGWIMATSFGALCTDFYVNQKLALKMDLPGDRETVLHMYDQVRKAVPSMDRFKRYESELALESSRRDAEYRWLAIRRTSIRTGHVNPQSMAEAYQLHRLILDVAPYHLTISPLDVDFVELLFGFDLECKANHDAIVFEALYGQSPISDLLRAPDAHILDVQPLFGLSLSDKGDTQAYFEVKTRTKSRRGGSGGRFRNEPISLFLTVRKYGPIHLVEDMQDVFEQLAHHAESLATDRLVPNLLTPISRQITSSSA